MAPNPNPAFINLADGTVTGDPKKASGESMPFLRGIAPKPTPTVTPPPAPPAPEPATDPAADTELVAAGTTEDQQ